MSLLPEFYSEGHEAKNGTVSAGYQNFLICIEMFFGSLALKHAFPHQVICANILGYTLIVSWNRFTENARTAVTVSQGPSQCRVFHHR